jgi:hypothetical protein
LMEEMSQSVFCLRMWCFNCTGPVAGGYGEQRALDGGDEPKRLLSAHVVF